MKEQKLTERELATAAKAQETKRRASALGMTGRAISEELKARAFPVTSEGYVSKALNGKLLTSGAAELLEAINAILNDREGGKTSKGEEVPTETTNPPETPAKPSQTGKVDAPKEEQKHQSAQGTPKKPATHSFRVAEAMKYGMDAAVVLNALRAVAETNAQAGLRYKGLPVAILGANELAAMMPYMSPDKAKKELGNLALDGAIVLVKDTQLARSAYAVEVI